MAQYAWVLEVRPGYEEEYVRRHQEIWPEMVEALKEAGMPRAVSRELPRMRPAPSCS